MQTNNSLIIACVHAEVKAHTARRQKQTVKVRMSVLEVCLF